MPGLEGENVATQEQLKNLQAELFAEEMKLALMKQARQSQIQVPHQTRTPVNTIVIDDDAEPVVASGERRLDCSEHLKRDLPPPPPLKLIEYRHSPPHQHQPYAAATRANAGERRRVGRLYQGFQKIRHEVTDTPFSGGGSEYRSGPSHQPSVAARVSHTVPSAGEQGFHKIQHEVAPSFSGARSNQTSRRAQSTASGTSTSLAESSRSLATAMDAHCEHVKQLAAIQHEVETFLDTVRPTLPPQYAWSLIPSLSCDQLRIVLGLEECVRELEAEQLRAKGRRIDNGYDTLPNTLKPSCRHCHTDHAPFWRSFVSDTDKEMVVVCENCDWLRVKFPFVQQHGLVISEAVTKAELHEREIARLEKLCKEDEQQISQGWQTIYGQTVPEGRH